MAVDGEMVAVISVQSIGRPEPHEAFDVLMNAEHVVVGEPVFNAKVFKSDFTPVGTETCRRNRKRRKQSGQQDSLILDST